MPDRKTEWLTVAPLLAVLTAWAERIIKGRTDASTEPPVEAQKERNASRRIGHDEKAGNVPDSETTRKIREL